MNGLASIRKSTTLGMDIAAIVAEKWIGVLSAMFGHKPVASIGAPVCALDKLKKVVQSISIMEHTCCNTELDFESAGNRDTETIGGFEVEYLRCSVCGQGYELILDSLDGDRLYPNDSPPPKCSAW